MRRGPMRWFDWSQGRLRVVLVSTVGSLVLTPLASGCSGDAHAAIETEEGPESRDPEVIAAKFPKGHTALTPYLRMTPQPNK